MKNVIICIAVLLVGFSTACEKKNTTSSATQGSISDSKPLEVPKIDLTTPEKAIYSYQAITNWRYAYYWETNRSGPIFEAESKRTEKVKSLEWSVYQDRVVQIFKQNQEIGKSRSAKKYEFTIEEMKKETDTRVIAMVKVRNITPIPTGAEPDEHASKERQKGKLFKIVLELENARWLISDISGFEDILKEWTPQISISKSKIGFYEYYVSLP